MSTDPAVVSEWPLYLVTLEETAAATTGHRRGVPRPDAADAGPRDSGAEESLEALRQQLRAKEELLQTANEELETSNEELISSNEEMQSVNEELQSANEELQTSREELQSVNEELATTNAELQTKVADLSLANNDMRNLLSGTGIGTLFVDRRLRILRFTPAVLGIVNLIPGDIGRPLDHVVSNLVDYDGLVADAEAVLDSLAPREREVRTAGGKWYTMRMLPYRTLDNVVEGVAVTFVDITETKQAREALEDAQTSRRLAIVARDSSDALAVHDLNDRILAWSPAAERFYGWTEAEALGMPFSTLVPPEYREELAKAGEPADDGGAEPHIAHRLTKDGKVLTVLVRAASLCDQSGAVYAIATTERLSPSERAPA